MGTGASKNQTVVSKQVQKKPESTETKNGVNNQVTSGTNGRSTVETNGQRASEGTTSNNSRNTSPGHKGSSEEGLVDPIDTQNNDPTNVSNNANMEFKIFRTASKNEYTVYVREEDGEMFFVDWEQQKWRVFPPEWKEHGTLLDYEQTIAERSRAEREGELIHPLRGKLTTLLRQETLNVAYYYDDKSRGWLPIPLLWERHTPFMSSLVADVKEACPDWKDDRSIVASLRQCNYNKDDVIGFYYAVNDEGAFDRFKDPSSGQSVLIEKLQRQLKDLEHQLEDCEKDNRKMKRNVSKLTNEVDELQDENKRLKDELRTIKNEQRKQSVNLRNSFGHGALRAQQHSVRFNVMKPLVQGAWREIHSVKLKLQSTKQVIVKSIKSHEDQIRKLSKAMKQLISNYQIQKSEIDEARALYRKEAQKRKLLYNEIQELRGNIRVFCRCRYDDRDVCALRFDHEDAVTCTNTHGRNKTFEFERVYNPKTTQEKVFEDTCPIITSCVDGYNVCILAYGQTGAGKTYTMMGTSDQPGVNIRSIKELFRIIEERDNMKFKMKLSMMEVYNESVYNLLMNSSNDVHEKLTIQQKGKDITVVGLTEIEVTCMEDVFKIISVGEKNRTTASTKMNTNSSRSHLLVGIQLEGYNKVSGVTSKGKLTLVDLAGSERISKSEATGQRLVEAAAINKSLSALGQVFSAIRDNMLHIPYRNSKLTHLLQPCLGGDAKACMFVNVSPLVGNMPETMSTLEFGSNARQVALGKATKNISRH